MSRFDKFDLVAIFKRWLTTRARLVRQIETLTRDNERLREKVAALQHSKEQTEKSLEERRREKKVLQANLTSQKRTSESKERVAEQLGAKLAELREENDRLLRGKDRREKDKL